MRKQNLQKMVKAITLGLVLGTTLTATSSVWATETHVKDDAGTPNIVFTYDPDTHWLKWGDSTIASGTRSTAWGDTTTASAFNSTAFGQGTTASAYAATAFGQGTTASGMYSTAFGQGTTASAYAAAAFGASTTASGMYSTAFGYGTYAGAVSSGTEIHVGTRSYTADKDYTGNSATAWGYQTFAIGDYSTAFGFNSEARGEGSTAWGRWSEAYGKYSTAFGSFSKAGGENSLAAVGGETGGYGAVAIGMDAKAKEAHSVAIGVGAIAKEKDSVAIGSYAQTGLGTKTTAKGNEVINEFAVGGGTDGDGKINYSQITGVADGVNDHDAATYGQLTSMGQELNSQIDRMGTRIDKVGAGAAALAAMHPVYDEDSKLTFSAGLGAYRGEQAAAVGMFYRFTDRVMMNAGATVGNNDNMYNVGLNFALDRNVGSKLPSKAVMAKQLNAQNERIDALTAENQDMKQEIAELKAMVQALIANK